MPGGLHSIIPLSCFRSCKRSLLVLFLTSYSVGKRMYCKTFSLVEILGFAYTYDVNREKVMLVLVKAMKNPRSALCKTSIMASSDIVKAFGDNLLDSFPSDAFEPLVRTHFFIFYLFYMYL